MKRSTESAVRRAFWRMTLWRLVGDLLHLPVIACLALQNICTLGVGVFKSFELTFFYAEQEAARQYKLLTGTDMGVAIGESTRYIGVSPERAQKVQDAIFGESVGDE